jgi:hypothetical protein
VTPTSLLQIEEAVKLGYTVREGGRTPPALAVTSGLETAARLIGCRQRGLSNAAESNSYRRWLVVAGFEFFTGSGTGVHFQNG